MDVEIGNWGSVLDSVAEWLALPPLRAVDPGDIARYVGLYRAPDGSTTNVEDSGGVLTVRGLHEVWPGQRLVPVADATFEVLSLPFTISFDSTGISVDGPELLGGRPPHRLSRLPAQSN